jgi:hypothetical protein
MAKANLSDPKVRDQVIAAFRKLKAEKKAFHVIHWKNRWKVLDERTERTRKSFADQDGAVEHARKLARELKFDLVVHDRDGSIRRESYREANGKAHS